MKRTKCVVAALVLTQGATLAQQTTMVSVSSLGQPGSLHSYPSLGASEDGRYLVFVSWAADLVPGDTNSFDVFRHDRLTGETRRVSVTSGGGEANGSSTEPSITADGRLVAFTSTAANLGVVLWAQVFVHDVQTSTTEMVSLTPAGTPANERCFEGDLSDDGRFVAFWSAADNLVAGDGNGVADVFVRDRVAGVTSRISLAVSGAPANGMCMTPRISGDGHSVVYVSAATNLAPGDTNGRTDVFVRDLISGTTIPITVQASFVGNGHSATPSISGDGQLVAFTSEASNLVPGDTNGVSDVFLWNRGTGAITRLSVSSAGVQGNGGSSNPSVSTDGRAVAFDSAASNLVPGDTAGYSDVFRRWLGTSTIERVSVTSQGIEANGNSGYTGISGDGRVVLFVGYATNLAGPINNAQQVFAHGPYCSDETIYCTAKVNSNGCTPNICSTGSTSLSGPDDFVITAHRVLNQSNGLFFWGWSPTAVPFGGGTRCVTNPAVRTPLQGSGGSTAASDCSGSYAYSFSHAYMASWGLAAGQHVYGQWWSRDPFLGGPNNIGLTDALDFQILP